MPYSKRLWACVVVSVVVMAGCDAVIDQLDLRVEEYEGAGLSATDVRQPWSVDVEGAEVTLTMGPTHINSDSMAIVAGLEDRPGQLPLLMDVWYGPHGGGVGTPVRKATVQIETWDLDRAVRGVLRVTLPSGGTLEEVFWLDLGDTDLGAR